jgi:hypothetical protein
VIRAAAKAPVPPFPPTPIVTSGILGAFRILRVIPPGETQRAPGVTGWKVRDAYGWVFEYRRLPAPILNVSGAQGFWRVPDAHVPALAALVAG